MTVKQMLISLGAATVSGLTVTAIALYLWNSHPEYLGLPIPPQQIDSVKIKSEAEMLHAKTDSLERFVASINDSLKTTSTALLSLRDREKALTEQIAETKKAQEKKDAALNDTTRLKNLQIAAEMYEKAQPAEVAKILSAAEPEYVASILKLMKRKNAAKVLEQMPTQKAVAVTKHFSKL